jgi:hypothetical protein
VIASARLVKHELKGWRIVAVLFCVLVFLSALASLALSGVMSIGMSS